MFQSDTGTAMGEGDVGVLSQEASSVSPHVPRDLCLSELLIVSLILEDHPVTFPRTPGHYTILFAASHAMLFLPL